MRTKLQCGIAIVLILSMLPVLTSHAYAQYASDGMIHEEGYIFIGSSHAVLAGYDMLTVIDAANKVIGLDDVYYAKNPLNEAARTGIGKPMEKDFEMLGNLFFVGDGLYVNLKSSQVKKEYIYSDGKGNCGEGVQGAHKIIETNPNIKHWNIISMQGFYQASLGRQDIADYYVASYKNWISYEFPEADCYFLSHPLISKEYRGKRNLDLLDKALAQAFPGQYMDYMDYFRARYPSGMRDPSEKSDAVHWSTDTYVGLITDVIKKIQANRAQVAATPVTMVLYTNENTVIRTKPSADAQVILAGCEQGLPIQVTGITNNGFYEVRLDGTYYIETSGLSEKTE